MGFPVSGVHADKSWIGHEAVAPASARKCGIGKADELRAVMESAQEYYRAHGKVTRAGARAAELRALPRDVGALCQVVQGLLIHRDIAPWLYDITLSTEQRDIANIRPVAEMLARILTANGQALTVAREPGARMPCVCWHFSTLLVGMLREQGVPARARCGFGAYFSNPGRFEDHWVAEYWNASRQRWVLVDAQLDSVQRRALKPDFDPLDVPHDRFIVAGDAWQMCRAGRADPDRFGLSFINLQGLWWIAANLVRDLASLNRMEMLPWDVWGIMPGPDGELGEHDAELLDRVAGLTLAGDYALPQVREVYDDDRLRVPTVVFNADRQVPEPIGV